MPPPVLSPRSILRSEIVFAMIEEPMQAVERDFAVRLFIDVQCPLDGLVVGRCVCETASDSPRDAESPLSARFP